MKRLLQFLFFAFIYVMTVEAVPAYRGAINALQPDGTTITFYINGDEHWHQCISTDGYLLKQDEDGGYRYASLTDKNMLTIQDSPLAHNPDMRSLTEIRYVGKLKKATELINNISRPDRMNKAMKQNSSNSRFKVGNYPTIGEGRCLVLLVEFADKDFSLDKDFHDRMLNESGFSDNGATGSARDYYIAQSSGVFVPHFDIVGPIKLSHNTAYYGSDSFMTTDQNAGLMIKEAGQLADSEYEIDFSQYDGDGDGKVDMVYVIYAGYGQHAGGGSNTIWPHKYLLSAYNINLNLDGKTVDTYACSSELFGNSGVQSSGIGTVCHEFSHVLGLADHYNTLDATDYKLGSYDIMEYGPYNNDGKTPPSYNAFERMTLGWLTPVELTEPTDNVTMGHLAETNSAYILTTSNENEFYLMENRQQQGWDRYIPSGGLMITHVDYDEKIWNNNSVNDDTSHPRFHLVPADNHLAYNAVAGGNTEEKDLYPISSNNSFTDISTPAAQPYTGETLDKWITDISDDNGTIVFNFMSNHLKTPKNIKADVNSNDSFTASWDMVEHASSYVINLYKLGYKSEQKVALQEGFYMMTSGTSESANSTDISESIDDYVTEKGWTGSKVYQAGGWCQIGNVSEGGMLTTPVLNLKRYDGNFAVAVTVKAASGETPVFSVSANGMSGKTRINSVCRTYLFRFNNGISKTPVSFATNLGRAIIDSITIVRGEDEGLFADAKVVEVSGEPEVIEGEVEDTDFLHTDTVTVDGVKELYYTFKNLEQKSYYAFAVKAVSSDAESAFSEEVVVYTDESSAITMPDNDKYGLDNAPVSIFTIDGRKVENMNVPGIYIIKKGNSVRKVATY